MLGNLVNALAIVLGGFIGLCLRRGISQRFSDIIMHGVGLAVGLIGLKMALRTNKELIVIMSMIVGCVIGEALDIQGFIDNIGKKINKMFKDGQGDFVKGFVTSTLVYCVGAMGIIGALESGLTGNNRTLFAKSAIDGITAIIFSSTMGLGVLFSSVPVLLYQGTITLLAHFIKTSDVVIAEMTATGGLLIIGIASNMLGIKEFKVANMLPSVFIAALLTIICTWIAPFLIKL